MKYSVLSLFFATAFVTVGCEATLETTCRKSTDCAPEEFCVAGACDDLTRALEAPATSEVPVDATVADPTPEERESSDELEDPSDVVFDPTTSPCGAASAPSAGDLVINEILASVPNEGGDANNDGVRDAYDDEFIELINISDRTLELARVRIRVDSKSKFVFEPHCLKAGEPLVLFGGGSVNIEARDVEAIASETRLSLSNSGAIVEVEAPEGELLASAEYGDLEARSWVLSPEIIGEEYAPHEPGPFSAGRCANGEKITRYCVPE